MFICENRIFAKIAQSAKNVCWEGSKARKRLYGTNDLIFKKKKKIKKSKKILRGGIKFLYLHIKYKKMKRFLFYLFRWQLSTPILWLITSLLLSRVGVLWSAIISNLVGGCIFYFVDRWLFSSKCFS